MMRWIVSGLLLFSMAAVGQDSVTTLKPRHFVGKKTQESKGGAVDVFLTAPIINGAARSESEVNDMIQTKIGNAAHCYTTCVTDGSSLKITLRFRITASGSVDNVSVVTKNIANGSLLSCLRNLVRQIQFKPAADRVMIEQSFLFRTI